MSLQSTPLRSYFKPMNQNLNSYRRTEYVGDKNSTVQQNIFQQLFLFLFLSFLFLFFVFVFACFVFQLHSYTSLSVKSRSGFSFLRAPHRTFLFPLLRASQSLRLLQKHESESESKSVSETLSQRPLFTSLNTLFFFSTLCSLCVLSLKFCDSYYNFLPLMCHCTCFFCLFL